MKNNTVDTPSVKEKKKFKFPFFKNTEFKSLGIIVKIISLVVAFAVLGIHVAAAFFLFAFKPAYTTICIAIVLLGLIVSLIVLFLIYALGHCICQNNKILEELKK
ncbi:MAG: hypothetical protein PUF48_01265 [Oscillospiraceae bacterium]|nr:hypothetical protein [Oscillospiraceae bacterium]